MPATNEFAQDGGAQAHIRLFHGSDVAIEHPDVSRNVGFADLGTGFYLTDDHDAALQRAKTRAHRLGAPAGVVSAFELDEGSVAWVKWGERGIEVPEGGVSGLFGLRFEESPQGLAAWIDYIRACRRGATALEGLGAPAIVRAWIATEEVEMVCSGLVDAQTVAPLLDADALVVQYCLLDQGLTDSALAYMGSERVCIS